ncbi:MAG: methyltransferase domain-containing protein [Gammaproteobacteria bacterium]|jgi:SAM-dependent methyltransferase|nr:methyltransferase domain-containing protein [Gammaproteobacteria bacterium]MBT5203709.1 methyltransferase domain-containing protein [Gammaproteobacteria bacterium]MBT5601700.1 methyltransferase domain-containing protein [Gammaproteobacteria bacterium]MBT6245237.1 methyltransferase domain-containing protein [Gammaproteobacteria bacterium]
MATVLVDQIIEINHWFESPLGKQLIDTETAILDELLAEMFGYHLLQMSFQQADLCVESPIQHRVKTSLLDLPGTDLSAYPDALPFESDCIDVVISHHLLDFCQKPQDLLREFSRVVLPGGWLVLIGFNPYSLWGLTRLLMSWSPKVPWAGHYLGPNRLMDWLNVLNFRIDRAIYSEYRLPLTGRRVRRPDYSLGLSQRNNLPIGAVSIIVARKQLETMIRLQPKWPRRRHFSNLGLVKPVAQLYPPEVGIMQKTKHQGPAYEN